MLPTTLVYSSHNRCNYIHNDWITQRALAGNKQVLFLPMSQRDDEHGYDRQLFSWNDFAWFFNYYRDYGLNAFPFFWSSSLKRQDADLLMRYLWESEVVILGGGNPLIGMAHYREIGRWFYDDPDLFGRILHERQERGLLTAGFSAGVDQLCQYMSSAVSEGWRDSDGFGLARNLVAGSHFDRGKEHELYAMARNLRHCLVFGLPNDSGLAVNQGFLPSGNIWQVIQMIIDKSWTKPQDQWHIKTRQGVNIQHMYADGRFWGFNGGDILVRIQSWDGEYNQGFIIQPGGPVYDYWTQQVVDHRSIEEILASY